MKNLRMAFMPVLLSTVALVGCAPNEKDDLQGMTHTIRNLCVDNAIDQDKFACVNAATEQATFLANHTGAKDKFKDVCDPSKPLEGEGSIDVVLQIEASRIRQCLQGIDTVGSPAVRMVTAEINRGLSRTFQ